MSSDRHNYWSTRTHLEATQPVAIVHFYEVINRLRLHICYCVFDGNATVQAVNLRSCQSSATQLSDARLLALNDNELQECPPVVGVGVRLRG